MKKNDNITSKEVIKDSYSNDKINLDQINKDNNNDIIFNSYKNNDDKTSFCHYILYEGEDVDISRKKIIECQEQTGTNFLLFKAYNKNKKLIFIEEQFLYILRDNNVNKEGDNMRRLTKKYDLCKLCNIEAKEEKNKIIYKLQFLKNDYFDRETRVFIFDDEGGTIFYERLVDTLEKVESTFFNDLSDDDEEEEEDEDNIEPLEDSQNDVDMSAKKLDFGLKNGDLISSSRKKII